MAADMRRYLTTSAVAIQAKASVEEFVGEGSINAVLSCHRGGDVAGAVLQSRLTIGRMSKYLSENLFLPVKLCNRFTLVLLAEIQSQH